MDQGGVIVVIGMTVAYVVSFAGMLLAFLAYRRRKKESDGEER